MFKGHGDSTTHTNQCKICTPTPFPWGTLLPHHTPHLVFCVPAKPVLSTSSLQGMAFLRLAPRRARVKISKMVLWPHQLAKPAQRWPIYVVVNLSGCPRQPQTWKLQVEVKLPFQHPSQPNAFSGLGFQRGPGTTRLRRPTKNFSQWHLIFFPQVKRTSCCQ